MKTSIFFFALITFFVPAPAFSAGAILAEVKTYDELLRAIRDVKTEARQSIESAIRQAKVLEAWKTGMLIEEHLAENQATRIYGDHLTARLAAQLGVSHSLLSRMRQFARAYPKGAPISQLSWQDYILLMRVSDLKKRDELAAAAEKENWTYAHLTHEIRGWRISQGATDDPDKLPEMNPPQVGIYPWVMMDGKNIMASGSLLILKRLACRRRKFHQGKVRAKRTFIHTRPWSRGL